MMTLLANGGQIQYVEPPSWFLDYREEKMPPVDTTANVLNELLGWAAKYLPDQWQVELTVYGGDAGDGEACLSLIDPGGSTVDPCLDNLNIVESIVECVNHALACEAEEKNQPAEIVSFP